MRAAIVLLGMWAGVAVAANGPARLIYPANAGNDVAPEITFQWTPADGALRYYLYVGTTVGANDVVNTGEIPQTSYRAVLTGGRVYYARIWTKYADRWQFGDTTFSVAPLSALIAPAASSLNVDPRIEFKWSSVANVQAYYLYVGTTPGAQDVVDTGELQVTAFKPSQPLVGGKTYYTRMYAKVANVWRFTSATFQTTPLAVFLAPTDGASGVDTSSQIRWSTVEGVQCYYLYVGSTPGSNDLINSGEITATSYSMVTLPAGKTVHARIYTKHQNQWRYTQISFDTLPVARFVTPAPTATEILNTQMASWTTVDGADRYYLTAGTSPGARDYIDSGELTATTHALTKLPAGATAHMRLYTRHGGVWRFVDRSISVAPVARILAPLDGAADVSRQPGVSWTAVIGAQSYYLYVGTTVGAKDLVDTGEIQGTSYAVRALPAGQRVYARLFTKRNNSWRFADSSFVTRFSSMLNLPAANTPIAANATLSWQPVDGAQGYYLYVGTIPGAKDLIDTGEIPATSYSLRAVAGGQTLYVRVHVLRDGRWQFEDYVLNTAPIAYLLAPTSGETDVDLERLTLTWNSVNNATAYRVELGPSQGTGDYYHSGDLAVTSLAVPPLPGGSTIHVRLWARQNGVWRSSDATFDGRAISQLTYPPANSTDFDVARPFAWTPVAGASSYSLRVGSTPGAADLANLASTTATQAAVPGIPAGQALHVRVGVNLATGWRYLDSVVRAGGALPNPAIVYPADGDPAVDAATPIEWQRDPLARSYRLTVGTEPGTADLHDSGAIRVNRRFVRDLPTGQTLHGRVRASYEDGSSAATDFSFQVASASIPAAALLEGAEWGTRQVRAMALSDNVAHGNTVLADIRRAEGKITANCETYALTLLAVLPEMGVAAPARTAAGCLNVNTFDCHTLTEMFDASSGRWVLLDPTFGMAIRNAGTGERTTLAELSERAREFDWTGIQYEFLTAAGSAYAAAYYMDYPTLFVNAFAPQGGVLIDDPPGTILPYYEQLADDSVNSRGSYALQCPQERSSVRALVDGSEVELACTSSDRLTKIFSATSIEPATAEPLVIFEAKRFVF